MKLIIYSDEWVNTLIVTESSICTYGGLSVKDSLSTLGLRPSQILYELFEHEVGSVKSTTICVPKALGISLMTNIVNGYRTGVYFGLDTRERYTVEYLMTHPYVCYMLDRSGHVTFSSRVNMCHVLQVYLNRVLDKLEQGIPNPYSLPALVGYAFTAGDRFIIAAEGRYELGIMDDIN